MLEVNVFRNYNCFMALCPGLPGWAGTRRNIHPLTPILLSSCVPTSDN